MGASEPEAHGGYYVSAREGQDEWLLVGPFDTHEEAIDYVAPAWTKAQEIDPRAFLWSVRTIRVKDPASRRPGQLNQALGI